MMKCQTLSLVETKKSMGDLLVANFVISVLNT